MWAFRIPPTEGRRSTGQGPCAEEAVSAGELAEGASMLFLQRLGAACGIAAFMAITGFAGTGVAGEKTDYTRKYYTAKHRLGAEAVGRNIRRYGLAGGKTPTKADYLRSTATIKKMLHPPKLVPVSQIASSSSGSSSTTTTVSSSSGSTASSGLAQCIINSESGGNPTVVNGSGHMGLGQWAQSTWEAHGGTRYAPTPLGATYQEQVQVINDALRKYGCSDWCPYDGCG